MRIAKLNKTLFEFETTSNLLWKIGSRLSALIILFYLIFELVNGQLTPEQILDIINRVK